MGAVIWAMIGPTVTRFAAPLAAVAALVLTLVGAQLYDRWIDDPAVAKAARLDFVRKAELTAAQALHAETLRQLAAARRVNGQYLAELQAARAAEAAASEILEQEIADYEKRLADNGRACLLNDADIEWLRNP